MAKCNVPDCKADAGDTGLCLGCLAKYRGGDASLRQYLKPASGEGDHRRPENPKLGTCRVPGCKRPAYCRGICQKHYLALISKTDVGAEARKSALPSKTCGSARRKGESPDVDDGNSNLLILLVMLKGADAERFSLLRDDGRDEVTIIDRENKIAFRATGISTVKVTQSRLE